MHKALTPKPTSFYFLISIIALFAVIVGFFTTYIAPSITGKFTAPLIIHIHGAFAFAWILLFFVQSVMVRYRKLRIHRSLGYLGVFFALGVVATMLPTGLFQVERDLQKGMGYTAISQIVGVITTALMFGVLVIAGLLYRRQPAIHKRLLLLATIVLLWPAWFRFRHYFPSVPRPDIWFAVVLADSLIVLAWVADKLTHKKIHPILLYGGLIIIAEHTVEVLLFDTPTWRVLAASIYQLLV